MLRAHLTQSQLREMVDVEASRRSVMSETRDARVLWPDYEFAPTMVKNFIQ
jgi:hypothetical protein